MRTSLRTIASIALVLSLPACTSGVTELQTVDGGPNMAAEELSGQYDVKLINGRRALDDFAITFARGGYGGDDGCNSFFGIGFGYADRFIVGPGSQTLLGCSSNSFEGRQRLKQGGIVSQVVGTGFTARAIRNGRIMLTSNGHEIVIEPSKKPLLLEVDSPRSLVGTDWEAFLLNSQRAPYPKTANNQYLRFGAKTVTAKFSCDSFSGAYVQTGNRIIVSDLTVIKGENCTADDEAKDNEYAALLGSEMGFVATNNSILIGSPAGKMFGERERSEPL